MFQMQLPLLEKLLRPAIVYLALVVLLRIFGKRELAQLNPFDLVVLLSLSNTVQNAIIGNDNSVSGGIIGAVALLAVNWLVGARLFSSPRLTRMFEGRSSVISPAMTNYKAVKRRVAHPRGAPRRHSKQGFDSVHRVQRCELEPTVLSMSSLTSPLSATNSTTNCWPGWMR